MNAYFLYLDDLPSCFIGDIIRVQTDEGATAIVAGIHKLIEGFLNDGHKIILARRTLDALKEACVKGQWPMLRKPVGWAVGDHLRGHPTGPRRLLEFLRSTYEMSQVSASGFHGVELRHRQYRP